MDNDSDSELLNDLLANNDTEENEEEPAAMPRKSLKELDFNFVDVASEKIENECSIKKAEKSEVYEKDVDSSDDEDKRYFEEQKYSDYGRSIKNLLKKTPPKTTENKSVLRETSSKSFDFNNAVKSTTFASSEIAACKDVYSDPFFGLRIVNPLVSSTELRAKMAGKLAVTVSKVKYHISSEKIENDWVIAGVITSKSTTKTSQKGSSYAIWKISDLLDNINTVCLFVFSSAYKTFWKTTVGSVIGILNPNIMESKDNSDLATLSVDNPQKIMILGKSKDMGKCKSVKKNGEPCTSIVNLSRCEYCIYHVKQEYKQYAKRAALQSSNTSNGFSLDYLKNKQKPLNINNMPNFTPVIAERNKKLEEKDAQRLALLSESCTRLNRSVDTKTEDMQKRKSIGVELSTQQTRKDLEKLKKLRGWSSPLEVVMSSSSTVQPTANTLPKMPSSKQNTTECNSLTVSSLPGSPRLGVGCVGGTIDFSEPITKKHIDRAKVNAIKWVQKNGKIKQKDPNKVRADKGEKLERGIKRSRETDCEDQNAKKRDVLSDKFKEMMQAKSAHTDLIEKSYQDEQEKYFKKLEIKEKMEEKMLSTYKVPCKAVKCLFCKYTAFSASDICKEQKHPLRVADAIKRFFKCADCGNRTVSLNRIPSHSCIKCCGSNWERAAMMDEKKTKVSTTPLSIRGGEEKFLGSTIKDANLDLLVPDTT